VGKRACKGMQANRDAHIFKCVRPGAVILSLCVIATAGTLHAETLTGRVVRIIDGDTITIADEDRQRHRIRIAGIDAPERRQLFGRQSEQNLSRLALEHDARLECHKADGNGERVCKVWVQPPDCQACGKTLDVGHAQVIVGLAWWNREHLGELSAEDNARYESEENEARLRHRGLWGDPQPVPPWEWRRQKREE
jgi:endonuclease YncB( thermonuclease family)